MLRGILLLLVAGGGLALTFNLLLPAVWFNLRVHRRAGWAKARGFRPYNNQDAAEVAGLFGLPGGKLLSCYNRGPLRILDFRYRRTLGGLSASGVDVNWVTTLVKVEIGWKLARTLVRPFASTQRRRLARAVELAGVLGGGFRSSAVDSLLTSWFTGDAAFDAAFRITGDDEAATVALL